MITRGFVVAMTADDARHRLWMLKEDLQRMVQTDGEQEVRGMALPVLDAVVASVRQFVAVDDPVLDAVRDVLVEVVESGEPVRATDALLVVSQLLAAIPSDPDPGVPTYFGTRENWFDKQW